MTKIHVQTEKRSSKNFPFFRFSGTHREIGQQHGEACKSLIRRNLELAFRRLQSKFENLSKDRIQEIALQYRPYVLKYAPYFDEEIQGIAKGADITLGEAYFLQVRAEVNQQFQINHNECTTFAIAPEATSNGIALIGQNADLPSFYSEVAIVAEFVPDEGSACLMLTPAGQVSYVGINNLGMGVFANFVTCDGWRFGFPRYMFSRLALTRDTVADAIGLIRETERSSSRNMIMMDKYGGMANLETTVTKDEWIEPVNGLLAHSNHYIGEKLLDEERLSGVELENSQARIERMYTLLRENHSKLNAVKMQDILRDRAGYPHCLCQIPGDDAVQSPGEKANDIITFASVIAEPSEGRLWVAVGPPNLYEYKSYTFS